MLIGDVNADADGTAEEVKAINMIGMIAVVPLRSICFEAMFVLLWL